MPDKNNTNRGQDVVFLTNTALRSRLRRKVLTRSRALSLPENTASASQATKSSIFSMIFGKNERSCTLSYYKWVFAKRRGNCDNLARLVLFLSGIHISNNKSQLFCEKNNQKIWHQTVIMLYYILLAVVAEQADAYVWGAYGRPYGFKSHRPHQQKRRWKSSFFHFLPKMLRRCRSVGAHVRCARATQMQALDCPSLAVDRTKKMTCTFIVQVIFFARKYGTWTGR